MPMVDQNMKQPRNNGRYSNNAIIQPLLIHSMDYTDHNYNVQHVLNYPSRIYIKYIYRFDPFLMVSVSIPQDSRKQIKVEIVDDNCIWNTTEQFYLYDGAKNLKIKDVLEEKAQEWLNCKEEEIIMTCSSTFNYEDGIL